MYLFQRPQKKKLTKSQLFTFALKDKDLCRLPFFKVISTDFKEQEMRVFFKFKHSIRHPDRKKACKLDSTFCTYIR